MSNEAARRVRTLVDDLVEDDADVPAALVELVEDGDPGGGSPVDEGGDERVDRVGVGQPEQVADGGLGRPSAAGRREHLVEHRLRRRASRRPRAGR